MNSKMGFSRRPILLGVHSLSAGGTERVVSVLLECLAGNSNYEVHCVLYGRKREIFYPIPEIVKIHRPNFQFDSYPRFVSTLKTIWFIRSLLKELRPEIFLNFGERWNNLALLSALSSGVQCAVADRSSPSVNLGRIQEFLRRTLYGSADPVIVQTEEAKRKLAARYPHLKKIAVIPNPLFDLPAPQSFDFAEKKEVLFVGRFIPTKHVDRLIRCFAQAYTPGWKLVIAGGDAQGFSMEKELVALAEQLGIANAVDFRGFSANVEQLYSRASIFAFPSSSEGFPNALAEALSFGLPSVAYDCSAGPADLIVDGGNGFLVPVFEDDLFVDRLSMLMSDLELRKKMSHSASQSVQGLEKKQIAKRFLDACVRQ